MSNICYDKRCQCTTVPFKNSECVDSDLKNISGTSKSESFSKKMNEICVSSMTKSENFKSKEIEPKFESKGNEKTYSRKDIKNLPISKRKPLGLGVKRKNNNNSPILAEKQQKTFVESQNPSNKFLDTSQEKCSSKDQHASDSLNIKVAPSEILNKANTLKNHSNNFFNVKQQKHSNSQHSLDSLNTIKTLAKRHSYENSSNAFRNPSIKNLKSQHNFSSNKQHLSDSTSRNENPPQTTLHTNNAQSKLKADECNKADKSIIDQLFVSLLKCSLPGCGKKFHSQKAYETHLKHFHGVFNFKSSEPIMTSLFYKEKLTSLHKSKSTNLKDKKTDENGKNKYYRDNIQPTTVLQNVELPSKYLGTEVLLPSSLISDKRAVSKEDFCEISNQDSLAKKKKPNKLHKDKSKIISIKKINSNLKSSRNLVLSSKKDLFLTELSTKNNNNIESLSDKNQNTSNDKTIKANNTDDNLSITDSSLNPVSSKTSKNTQKKLVVSSKKTIFQTVLSTENSNNVRILGDDNQNASSDRTVIVNNKEHILSFSLLNTNDSLNGESSKTSKERVSDVRNIVHEDPKTSKQRVPDLRNVVHEDHLYATQGLLHNDQEKHLQDSQKSDERCEDFTNKNKYELISSSKKDLVPELTVNKKVTNRVFKSNGNLYTEFYNKYYHSAVLMEHIDDSKVVSSYKELLKNNEEQLVLTSILQDKIIELNEKPKKMEKILTAVFDSLANVKPTQSSSTVGGKVVFILSHSFKLCNHGNNLKDILFKCKQLIDNLCNYILPKIQSVNENASYLPNPDNTGEKTNKLLHYIFFLDVIRDTTFTSYIQSVLTSNEKEVINELYDPVSLYLTNTNSELPNIKLRRDREFMQRNSAFFKVFLKIQKYCYILPYAKSTVSIKELFHPLTKLRLEKSDYFAQVFLDARMKKDIVLMQSYGADKDLSVSPHMNCLSDDYYVHKLTGFVMLQKPKLNYVSKDMCVGLCFESTPLLLKNCIVELTLAVRGVEEISSTINTELIGINSVDDNTTYLISKLSSLFNSIGKDAKNMLLSLHSLSLNMHKLPDNIEYLCLSEPEKELIKNSIKDIGQILKEVKDLKECKDIL